MIRPDPAVTPLRKILGWNWLLKLRRNLGLYAFYYGIVHLATYPHGPLKVLPVRQTIAPRP